MGAPGEAFLCRKGHLYLWIEYGLYWDEDLFAESERTKQEGCLCGERSVNVVNHYGHINDCLEDKLVQAGAETFRWRERIPNAVNAYGYPLEAYMDRERTLEVYDVSALFAE